MRRPVGQACLPPYLALTWITTVAIKWALLREWVEVRDLLCGLGMGI